MITICAGFRRYLEYSETRGKPFSTFCLPCLPLSITYVNKRRAEKDIFESFVVEVDTTQNRQLLESLISFSIKSSRKFDPFWSKTKNVKTNFLPFPSLSSYSYGNHFVFHISFTLVSLFLLLLYVSLPLSIHPSIYPYIYLFIYLFLSLSIYPYLYLSIHQSIHISIYLYLSLSIYLDLPLQMIHFHLIAVIAFCLGTFLLLLFPPFLFVLFISVPLSLSLFRFLPIPSLHLRRSPFWTKKL